MVRGTFTDNIADLENKVADLESGTAFLPREQHLSIENFYTTDDLGTGIVPVGSRVGRSVSLGDAGVLETEEPQTYDFMGGPGQGIVLPPGKFVVEITPQTSNLGSFLSTANGTRIGFFAAVESGVNVLSETFANPGLLISRQVPANLDNRMAFERPGAHKITSQSNVTRNIFWYWFFEDAVCFTVNENVKIDIIEVQ